MLPFLSHGGSALGKVAHKGVDRFRFATHRGESQHFDEVPKPDLDPIGVNALKDGRHGSHMVGSRRRWA